MSDERIQPLIAGVGRSLPFRFRRKRLSWWAALPDVTIGLNLSARWSGRYTIELGAHPNDFLNPYYAFEPAKIGLYDFRARADKLVPAGTDLTAFDLDVTIDATAREDRVAEIIALLVPHMLAWSTCNGLREAANQSQGFMHAALRRWLGVPPKERSAEDLAAFAERLVRFRAQAALDPNVVAERAGIDPARLADAEAGQSSLYDDEYIQLGMAYGIDPSLIMGGSGKVIIRKYTG